MRGLLVPPLVLQAVSIETLRGLHHLFITGVTHSTGPFTSQIESDDGSNETSTTHLAHARDVLPQVPSPCPGCQGTHVLH